MTEDEISRRIIAAAIEVHRTLGGPGLLELARCGHPARRQVSLPICYKGQKLTSSLRIDLIVDELVIVECKSITHYNPIFEVQTLTYLRKAGMSRQVFRR